MLLYSSLFFFSVVSWNYISLQEQPPSCPVIFVHIITHLPNPIVCYSVQTCIQNLSWNRHKLAIHASEKRIDVCVKKRFWDAYTSWLFDARTHCPQCNMCKIRTPANFSWARSMWQPLLSVFPVCFLHHHTSPRMGSALLTSPLQRHR